MSTPEQRLAEVAVNVGANVQPGQDVVVLAFDVEQAPVARAVADAAYRAGARFVSVFYWDQHVKRSRLEHAPAETLDFRPGWWGAWLTDSIERQSALIIVWGDPHPRVLDGIDPNRVARDHMPLSPDLFAAVSQGQISWTFIPGPSPGVAEAMLGERDVDRLWQVLTPILRLDSPDPAAAWREHLARLQARTEALERHEFPALRFRGAGTDLTVGLLRGARWLSAALETRWGSPMVVNMPSEEVFTTPDFRRTRGTIRTTRPVNLLAGGRVEDLVLHFEAGRVVEIEAARGADLVRSMLDTDPGAGRLGEVALVDGSSPVGQTGLVFGDTLIDENATCHVALGNAYAFTVPDLPEEDEAWEEIGFNTSAIHQDVMIGGPEIDVFGLASGGVEVPVIVGDAWVLS